MCTFDEIDLLPNTELFGVVNSPSENSRTVPKDAYVLDHKA